MSAVAVEGEELEIEEKEQKSYKKKSIFCCKATFFYKEVRTDHEDLFDAFLKFDKDGQPPQPTRDDQRGLQVVRQKDFGPVEEKRYFSLPGFKEITEEDFQREGYKRLNSFKNLKCKVHSLFFEVNAYRKKSAVSRHHRSVVEGASYERDAADIDLASGSDKGIRIR